MRLAIISFFIFLIIHESNISTQETSTNTDSSSVAPEETSFTQITKVSSKPMHDTKNPQDTQQQLNITQPQPQPQPQQQTVSQTQTSTCNEADPQSLCTSKPNCCFVTNYYGKSIYMGCIDVLSPSNYETFCRNFFKFNRDDGYTPSICQCMNYIHNSSSILTLPLLTLMSFIIILLI